MTDLVPTYKIEQIVDVPRHARLHYGRAVSAEDTFYILHSQLCLDKSTDLRLCAYSRALDNGLPEPLWESHLDEPMPLSIVGGKLWPGVIAGHETKAGVDFE